MIITTNWKPHYSDDFIKDRNTKERHGDGRGAGGCYVQKYSIMECWNLVSLFKLTLCVAEHIYEPDTRSQAQSKAPKVTDMSILWDLRPDCETVSDK